MCRTRSVTKSTFASRSFVCSSLVVVATLAWLGSLSLPAIASSGGTGYTGLRVLLEGWRTLALGIPSWCANPAFIIAWGLLVAQRVRAAAVMSGLSLMLAASSIAAPTFAGMAGNTLPQFEFRLGFFLWISSIFALFLGTFCHVRVRARGARTRY